MGEHRCSQYVADPISGMLYLCQRNGLLLEDGKHWCRQHAPSSIKARTAASWERAEKKRKARYGRTDACIAACAGVDDPQPGELAALRAEVAKMRGEG